MVDHCRADQDCLALTSDGPAITVRQNTLCPGCLVGIQKCADELPHLALALWTLRAGAMGVTYGSKVSSSHNPAPPLDLHIHDLLGEIAEARGYTVGLSITDLALRPPELFVIWTKGEKVSAYLDGVDRALRIMAIHKKAADRAGLHPKWQRRAAPCPECGEFTLGNWVGSDFVSCEQCEKCITRDEYDKWCLEKASE